MIWRFTVPDTDISYIDVLIPCRKTGDMLIRHLFFHTADSIVWRKSFFEYVFLEKKCHLVCDKHLRSVIFVVLVYFVLCGKRIVFTVFSSVPVFWIGNREWNCYFRQFVPKQKLFS